MIVLEQKVSMRIKKLQSLLRRLPDHHPKRKVVEDELGKNLAGHKGESSLDYYLKFLPEQEYFILRGLRLPYQDFYYQIDTLLLTKFFFLIVEIKYVSGQLVFDDTFKQLIRIKDDGTKEAFSDPLQQVKHQQFQFQTWLKEQNDLSVPLNHLVVSTNPNSILKTNNPNSEYVNKIVPSSQFLDKITQLEHSHIKEFISIKQIRSLSKRLLKDHEPESPDILSLFHIDKSELITGVQCPKCTYSPMTRYYGRWICSQCETSVKDGHVSALLDYSLLIDDEITNSEMRKYLHVQSDNVVYKLLRSMNLPQKGKTKGRVYSLHVLEQP